MKAAMDVGQRGWAWSYEVNTDSTSLLRFTSLINIYKVSTMGQALIPEALLKASILVEWNG